MLLSKVIVSVGEESVVFKVPTTNMFRIIDVNDTKSKGISEKRK